jgi:ribosomal protein S18 acetylase RimI-like enzyme
MIIPIERKHAREIATLHHKYTKSLLRDLGKRMCIVFYETELESDKNFGFVYIENSKVMGFILGTEDNSRLFKNPRILLEIAIALLKKPWLIRRLIFHMIKRFPATPEALYSALDVHCRGKGVGKKLYSALHEEFRKRGITCYERKVDADNVPALMILQKLGSIIVDEFMEDGKRRFRIQTKIE